MTSGKCDIAVCICTLNRQTLLKRLLEHLQGQQTGDLFSFSIVVADNDVSGSAKAVVEEFAAGSQIHVKYCIEPKRNIALCRNRALENAVGDYIAFIDDDEFPSPNWLAVLFDTCKRSTADGVLGPVRPHFDEQPPKWIVRGGFCQRPEHKSGTIIPWDRSRTGNVLLRRRVFDGLSQPFNEAFGTGGEDKDFFMRVTEAGRVFIWCNEAVVYETVPPSRWKRSYMLKRALLRGKNIIKHPTGRHEVIARSFAAVPVYLFILPFVILFGQHRFMKHCIKLCDHLGRLLALAGLNPVSDR
jgi:glycosyltransferase involved in cell wall biosynthesis